MSGPPMQSEPRPEHVQDYNVRITGLAHDMTEQDANHFCRAVGEHLRHHGVATYRCELEEIG
jgi:hypothetical protein